MIVDTHAHIYLDAFVDDFDAMLDRAHGAGVEKIVMPAIDVPSIEQAIELAERHEGLYAMAALHPSEVKDAATVDFARVAELCSNPHVVAVGETGLDYHWDRTFDEKQQAFLRKHIHLAVEADLPIVFHNREATADLVRIVAEERAMLEDPARLRGIFHCFTGDAAEASRIRDLGFYLGIGGIVTFKNSTLGATVRDIRLEHIVLETDSPYLTPSPHRGKRNEPAYAKLVAEGIAALKDVAIDEIARTTSTTACELFGI